MMMTVSSNTTHRKDSPSPNLNSIVDLLTDISYVNTMIQLLHQPLLEVQVNLIMSKYVHDSYYTLIQLYIYTIYNIEPISSMMQINLAGHT